jgi:hypothetical protein
VGLGRARLAGVVLGSPYRFSDVSVVGWDPSPVGARVVEGVCWVVVSMLRLGGACFQRLTVRHTTFCGAEGACCLLFSGCYSSQGPKPYPVVSGGPRNSNSCCNHQFPYQCSTISARAKSLSTGSQLYVKKNSHATVQQYLTKPQIAWLKGVPLIKSPHHPPARLRLTTS